MKVTDLLKKQHREVESLFARIESANGEKKVALVRELASKLAAHMRIEEEIVYPVARELDEDLTMEALEEHTVAAFELKRLADAGMGHEAADAKIKVLKELIKHHVEEEEKSMLPKLDRQLDRQENVELGEECETRFETIVASGYGGELFAVRGAPRRGRAMRLEMRARH